MGANISQKISGDDITRIRANTTNYIPESQVHSTDHMVGSAEVELAFNRTYEMVRLLGRGASAEVHLVRHRESRKEYACKIIRKTNGMNDDKTMKTETTIMKKLQHRNLLQLYELFETEDSLWMIMEYANGGDLMHALASLPVYNERAISQLFRQILLGVQSLHSLGVVHRDLKLDNILFMKDEENNIEVKIADFGLSALTNQKRSDHTNNKRNSQKLKNTKALKEMWGTLEYFAPEVFDRAYGSQADIWALGCILYEMLTGELAFPSREIVPSVYEKVMSKGLSKKQMRTFETRASWKELSEEAQSLIKAMLKRNPSKRFDIDECLSHPWITGEALTERHEIELLKTKKIVEERSDRRLKRYEALVREVQRANAHKHALSLVKVM